MTGRTHLRLSPAAHCGTLAIWAAALLLVSSQAQSSSDDSAMANRSQQIATPATTTQTPPAIGQVKTNTPDPAVMPLRSRADLIPIRIVVRDHQGRPVANLRKEDFRVFEDRKPQDISYFSVETPDTILQTFGVSAPSIDKPAADKNEPSEPTAASVRPSHFVALLFDDLHDTVEDLFHTRDAAIHFIDGSLAPNDRIGIFTISGKSQADFTTDRDKLRATLLGLRQQSVAGAMPPGTRQCPTIDYYQADQILNKGNALEGDPEPGNPHEPIGQHDQQNPALLVAIYDALNCAYGDDKALLQEARQLAMSTAKRVEEEGQVATRDSFRRLTELVRAIAALPGQRSVSVLSPGFIAPKNQQEL
ncbi:MAG TPA: VWA domain-containing protein, partial [Candidatus Acidoferrales bacterium]|nr:VWA domain-containing protein [Candidatus Acidoferrales bacterium]